MMVCAFRPPPDPDGSGVPMIGGLEPLRFVANRRAPASSMTPVAASAQAGTPRVRDSIGVGTVIGSVRRSRSRGGGSIKDGVLGPTATGVHQEHVQREDRGRQCAQADPRAEHQPEPEDEPVDLFGRRRLRQQRAMHHAARDQSQAGNGRPGEGGPQRRLGEERPSPVPSQQPRECVIGKRQERECGGSEQPEASTLLFTNGQSLSLQASRNERGDISVLVHCTAPRASDVRYAVYNFDSLVDGYSDLKVGREHCKSSEIVKDFAKFAELRFPIRDLEAAQLQDGLHREKCVDELMRVITEESFEEIEPLAPSCTTESEKLHGDQADESNQPQIVKQLKNWIRRQNSRHNQLYRFSRKVTTFTVQNYLNKNLPALENDDHDEPAECLGPFPSRDGERFPIDIDSLNFVLFSRESVCDLDVTKLVGRQDTSVMSEIYRIIGEYCAGLENESRWFVGTGIHGRGKFSKLPAYLPLPQDTATAAISPRVKTKVFPSCFYEGFSVVTSVTCFPPECERCNQISLQWIYAATGWDKINASYRSYALGSESQYSAELPTLPEKSSSRMLRFMSDLSCLTG